MSNNAITRREFARRAAAFGAVASVAAPVLAAAQTASKWPQLSSRGQADDTATLRIAVGGQGSLYYLPLTAALALGYFRDEGLRVEIRDYAGGSLAMQAVRDGEADLGCGAYEQLIEQQLAGYACRSIALVGRAPQLALAASTRMWPKKSLTTYKDLRIGVSAPGSSSQFIASLWLRQAGIPLETVSFVGVGSSFGALEAVRQKRVHALCHADPLITLLEQNAEVRILADTRTLKDSAEFFGGPMPGACLWAPQSFIRTHSRQTQSLVDAMVHALKWMQTAGPMDLARIVPMQYWLDDRAAYLAAFEKVRETLSPDGLMFGEGPATALNALARIHSDQSALRVDLAATYSNDWVRKAKLKFQL